MAVLVMLGECHFLKATMMAGEKVGLSTDRTSWV